MQSTTDTHTSFRIGAVVATRDGDFGELTRVVLDPVTDSLTHLVVEAAEADRTPRLVPVEMVDAAESRPAGTGIALRCSRAEFDQLEPAEETKFIDVPPGSGGYASGQIWGWPYYPYESAMLPAVGGLEPVRYDKTPPGEVAIRRGDQVHALDGDIGRVQGLVVHPQDRHVTHVLLQQGHLWGRKEVAIPITAVLDVEAGIRLNMTKDQIKDLPEPSRPST